MAEEQLKKSFWKRYEYAIIAVITLVFIYLIVFFNQKINFLLGNELIVYLEPQQKSFSMHYGDAGKAQFDVSIDNVAYCRASCSYAFTDRSASTTIDKGDFEIEKKQHFRKEYELGVKRLGSGQDIYSFDVKCHSIRSFLCLTKSPEKSRTSLVTVNYDLTETEKALKRELKQNLTQVLELLADVDVLHQQINQKYFQLAHKLNLNNLSKQKIDIDDAYDKTRISIENLKAIWAVEDYIRLSQLFNESFFAALKSIRQSLTNLDRDIGSLAVLHNYLLARLDIIGKSQKELNSFANVLENNETSSMLSDNIVKFESAASSITNNTFEDYATLAEEADSVETEYEALAEKSKIPSASLFFDLEYALINEKDMLCSLRQDCGNISVEKAIENAGDFLEKYPDSIFLRRNCNSLKSLELEFADVRNKTTMLISDKNMSFPLGNDFLELADNFKGNLQREINNSYYKSLEKIKTENKTSQEVIEIAELALPKNLTNGIPLNYNESLNLSLYLLSNLSVSEQTKRLIQKCQSLEKPSIKMRIFDFTPINTSISYTITSRIDTNLSDNPPICCIFSECKPCCNDDSCRNDPKTFPVILLHGHSFAKDNSPEFSLDSFNRLQARLQEDGYLNAGVVSLYSKNEILQQGIWGLSGKPVAVKASYYYDAFRKDDKYILVPTKSENIDTYALRLKDIIEIVKERTGKPKVNIIAHSMGGLVARRYIQIFGEDGIGKLARIAVPNKGISGAVGDICGFIGENRECQDMQENSLFINKLNDPLKQPSKVRIYNIIGQGCAMKLGDGDGIVLAEKAKLENAQTYFVNGTCGLFGGNLHTEMLNIEKYNETYRIIKDVLKE